MTCRTPSANPAAASTTSSWLPVSLATFSVAILVLSLPPSERLGPGGPYISSMPKTLRSPAFCSLSASNFLLFFSTCTSSDDNIRFRLTHLGLCICISCIEGIVNCVKLSIKAKCCGKACYLFFAMPWVRSTSKYLRIHFFLTSAVASASHSYFAFKVTDEPSLLFSKFKANTSRHMRAILILGRSKVLSNSLTLLKIN